MRRKLINTAVYYAVAGLFAGAFYREFTKYMGYTGVTSLGKAHTHLFALGMLMFLIVTALASTTEITKSEYFDRFYFYYNIGVGLSATMIFCRGLYQVIGLDNKILDLVISWTAGAGHVTVTIGLAFLFLSLKQTIKD
ncbi:DUF2871 domain-containing protein [uncultured Fenollaria sp.]|uniref:DUF2871 domain-containing protein n=1 Tax=uncultured Fenollaria sp. TaxID=1686315 RepID=UPI0025CED432|nr:DUF2871 domain-containing protein [uncultured Fenollaria sp.]